MNILRPLLARFIIVAALLIHAVAAPQTFELTVDAPPSLAAAAARVKGVNAASLEASLSRAGLHLPAESGSGWRL